MTVKISNASTNAAFPVCGITLIVCAAIGRRTGYLKAERKELSNLERMSADAGGGYNYEGEKTKECTAAKFSLLYNGSANPFRDEIILSSGRL